MTSAPPGWSIMTAGPADVERIAEAYARAWISPERLTSLRSHDETVRQRAIDELEQHGGFLHGCDRKDIEQAISDGLLLYIQGREQKVAAYYSVLTAKARVEEHMARELRFDRERPYDAEIDLPQFSDVEYELADGGRVQRSILWTNHALGCQTFRDARSGRLVWSLDNAVVGGSAIPRGSGVGRALKNELFSRLGRCRVILKIFEIIGFNGEEVLPPVRNVHSYLLNLSLGGRLMAIVRERLFRSPGCELLVNWHYLVIPLRG